MAFNLFSDVSSIALAIQEDAIGVVRETLTADQWVTVFNDMTGLAPRKSFEFNQGTAVVVGESDDLTSHAFTPASKSTLTPAEIGLQFFITDSRAESDGQLPENVMTDAARELGLAATDKLQLDLIGDYTSLTGGTVGAAGTIITWGYVAAAIAQARNANKTNSIPLTCVMHEYQWAVLASKASIAGATIAAVAPNFQENINNNMINVATFMGVPIYQTFEAADTNGDFTGGVFPRLALALDWRRPIRIRPQRDESRRGLELNMSAVYAHGGWYPNRGVQFIFDAAAPTS